MKLSILSVSLVAALLTACTTPTGTAPSSDAGPPSTGIGLSSSDSTRLASLVASSACSKHSWKDRGTATFGYFEGLARAYHTSICRYKSPKTTAAGVMGMSVGSPSQDALALYALNSSSGLARIKDVYTLLFGLGMRESSGVYCTGRDTSASNYSGDTCEAGTFQTSYNSRAASPELLQALWDDYRAHPDACDFDIWARGVDPHSKANWNCLTPEAGSGTGLAWQKFVRGCPAFGAEWAAVILRKIRSHYGPINTRQAEFNQDCKALLDQVEALPCQ